MTNYLHIKATPIIFWGTFDANGNTPVDVLFSVDKSQVENFFISPQDVAFSLGADDPINGSFATLEDGIAYYGPAAGDLLLASANVQTSDHYDAWYWSYLDEPTKHVTDLKQDLNTNLTAFAGLTLGSGKIPYATGGSSISTFDSSSYMRGLMNTANLAALQTGLGVSAVGLSGAYSDLTGKPSLATVATSGAYADLTGKPTIPSTTRTTSTYTPSLVGTGATGTQLSTTKDATVRATFSTQVTITLGGSPVSRVIGKICSTNSATETDWVEVGRTGTSQPTTLSVTVGGVYLQEGQVCMDVPAGYYHKFVNSGSGTHSEAAVSGQKTIYG